MLKEIVFTLLVAGCVVAFPQIPNYELNQNFTQRSNRIVGGRDASIEEFPFMAAVLFMGVQNCGGSILNANTVMSAAHCIGGAASSFSIRAGSNRWQSGGQVVPVSRIIIHEQYRSNPRMENDIVILKLQRNLVMSASVRAIALPVQGFAVPHLSTAVVIGWGGNNRAGDRFPLVLQALSTPVIGNNQCEDRIPGMWIERNEICAGGVVGRDACYGDSGGPLTFQGRVVGILAWGPGIECGVGWPNVYTRVSEHIPFIVRNM